MSAPLPTSAAFSALLAQPESLHPALWRASQLAQAGGECVDTGYPALSAQLPGGGWPRGAMVELLPERAGVGEIRLLRPALQQGGSGRIVLLQPPWVPQAAAFDALGLPARRLLWLRSTCRSDTLWAAEQVLGSGACSALLLWQSDLRNDALRRLHLAAQSSNSLFFLLRPPVVAQDASPAPLRLALKTMAALPRAAADLPLLRIDILKRRGPHLSHPLFVHLQACPGAFYRHVSVDRNTSAATATGSVLPASRHSAATSDGGQRRLAKVAS